MKVRELLSDNTKWCQQFYARTLQGQPTYAGHEDAVQWCLIGAIRKCYVSDDHVRNIITRATDSVGQPLAKFNDSSTFVEVKALVERLDI